VVDPVGEAGLDIARFAALKAGLGNVRSRHSDQPLLRLRSRCSEFAAAQIMSGQHESHRGGAIHERVGIGASGGAWPMDPSIAVPAYFMPARRVADLIATKYGFSARRRRRLCGAEPAARGRKAWDEGRFKNSVCR